MVARFFCASCLAGFPLLAAAHLRHHGLGLHRAESRGQRPLRFSILPRQHRRHLALSLRRHGQALLLRHKRYQLRDTAPSPPIAAISAHPIAPSSATAAALFSLRFLQRIPCTRCTSSGRRCHAPSDNASARRSSPRSARLARQAAYARGAFVMRTTPSSHAISRSRHSRCSIHTSAGFSGNATSASFCARFVQSSRAAQMLRLVQHNLIKLARGQPRHQPRGNQNPRRQKTNYARPVQHLRRANRHRPPRTVPQRRCQRFTHRQPAARPSTTAAAESSAPPDLLRESPKPHPERRNRQAPTRIQLQQRRHAAPRRFRAAPIPAGARTEMQQWQPRQSQRRPQIPLPTSQSDAQQKSAASASKQSPARKQSPLPARSNVTSVVAAVQANADARHAHNAGAVIPKSPISVARCII